MPEDRESRSNGLLVQEIFESHPNADWELKDILYDATTNKEDKRFPKGSRLRDGLVDTLPYDRKVYRGNAKAQTPLYPPMFGKGGSK